MAAVMMTATAKTSPGTAATARPTLSAVIATASARAFRLRRSVSSQRAMATARRSRPGAMLAQALGGVGANTATRQAAETLRRQTRREQVPSTSWRLVRSSRVPPGGPMRPAAGTRRHRNQLAGQLPSRSMGVRCETRRIWIDPPRGGSPPQADLPLKASTSTSARFTEWIPSPVLREDTADTPDHQRAVWSACGGTWTAGGGQVGRRAGFLG